MDWDKIKDVAKGLPEKGLDASKGLAEKGMDASKEKRELKKAEEQAFKDRIAEMDRNGTVYCPKCYSTNITAGKRGWKMTTGLLGSSKVLNTCMKCGNQWKPGKR